MKALNILRIWLYCLTKRSMWVFNRGVNPELTQEALESFFLLSLKESRKQIKVVLFIYLFIYFSLPRVSPGAHSLKKSPGSLGIRLKQQENESAQLMFQKLIPRIDYGDQQLSLQYVCEENPLNVTIQIQKKLFGSTCVWYSSILISNLFGSWFNTRPHI